AQAHPDLAMAMVPEHPAVVFQVPVPAWGPNLPLRLTKNRCTGAPITTPVPRPLTSPLSLTFPLMIQARPSALVSAERIPSTTWNGTVYSFAQRGPPFFVVRTEIQ